MKEMSAAYFILDETNLEMQSALVIWEDKFLRRN